MAGGSTVEGSSTSVRSSALCVLPAADDKYLKTENTVISADTYIEVPGGVGDGWKCDSQDSCAEQSALLCDSLGDSCQGFAFTKASTGGASWHGGVVPMLSSSADTGTLGANSDWTSWTKP